MNASLYVLTAFVFVAASCFQCAASLYLADKTHPDIDELGDCFETHKKCCFARMQRRKNKKVRKTLKLMNKLGWVDEKKQLKLDDMQVDIIINEEMQKEKRRG